ncbi:inactive peptidyl-prolyl cis-trans isomerase FKBP6-like protein [Dinothrombium tinctorium]|uniref:peptidylprolyl isomerase n=1 Tax=Dinothrombium tinctorium TaxID=1965070 RepID=A0A443QBJ5_9ACAR|nr:inactive peptidyl-prolyl cis-trans isomerase FKBP6-like protein [Dinothrombium tinctorium]
MDVIANHETSGHLRPAHRLKQAIKFEQLEDGVEFETEQNEEEYEDFDENPLWWSNDELKEFLKREANDESIAENERSIAFDELSEKMQSLTEDGGVRKRVIRNGIGNTINESNSVSYHYEAYLEGEIEPFDSTILRGRPFLHRLNYDFIYRGLVVALKSMKQFELSQFLIKSEYAYGELGCSPRIPPNSSILCRVEVLKIFEEGSLAHFEALTGEDQAKFNLEDILRMCEEERISGNSYYKERKYKEAAFRYRKAIQVLEHKIYSERIKSDKAENALQKLYCNAAIAYIKIDKPKTAISFCDRALKNDEKIIKAILYKAIAKRMKNEYDEAKELLKEAMNLDLELNQGLCPAIAKEMKNLEEKLKIEDAKEKDLYSKMSKAFIH